jgi:invasion protein IalB
MTPMQALLAGCAVAAAGIGQAQAAGSGHLGDFQDWSAYAQSEKTGKVCYAATLPKKSQNTPKKRGPTFISVTHRPGEKSTNVVSIDAGFALKPDSEVEVVIDGSKFKLFTKGEGAWARDPATDKALVDAMRKGKSLTISGLPAKGAVVLDTYSLAGFGTAYAKIGEACGVK